MVEKSVADLNFVSSREPIPTVEVDLDSLPEELDGYGDLIARALQPIASRSPETLASIYVYQGSSCNFGTSTFSRYL